MTVGAILPHLQQFGGVRRFLEIGNVLVKRGIPYTLFTKQDRACGWLPFSGSVKDWSNIAADRILFGDAGSFQLLPRIRGRIYIYVIAGGMYIEMYKKVYGRYPFITNNRVFLKYFPKAHLVEGGVNIHHFKPTRPVGASDKVRVLYYNGLGPHKNAGFIRKQLSNINGVKLIGLRGLSNAELARVYQSGDFFVAWESREGWSNTAAEAAASGLTVVTNGFNCEPFINKVIKVTNLRAFFSDPNNRKIRKRCSMKEFSWEVVVDQLLKIIR